MVDDADGRERLIALEVEVRHLSRQASELAAEVRRLSAVLERGKGAWWIIAIAGMPFSGALGALVTKLWPGH